MSRIAILGAALAFALPLAQAATDDPVASLVKQADRSRLLIIGEMHGTSEWQGHETGHQAYLASNGNAADRQRLLASPFWSKPYQDGRASQAMFALLESVRLQARSGRPVRLATFDLNQGQPGERDEGMAHNLRAIA